MPRMDSRPHAARILHVIRAEMKSVPRELRPEVTDHLHRALWQGTLAYRCQERAKKRHRQSKGEAA